MVAASSTAAVAFSLSSGNANDGPEGRKLLATMSRPDNCKGASILMDKAYEGDETRLSALSRGFIPVVPPKANRKNPWDCDKELYKRRNEVERLFRRLKGFRRVATRFDKLDVVFKGFILLAFIVECLIRSVNKP